jgi:hypothetical protein
VKAALEGPVETAAEILRAAERRHRLRWFNLPDNAEVEDQSSDWYELHLWPFLTETHFVLTAGELFRTGCGLIDPSGVDHTPTWRHWGEIVAGWANRHWFPRPDEHGTAINRSIGKPWGYLDFYTFGYLSPFIADYDQWRGAMWRVLSLTGNGEIPR